MNETAHRTRRIARNTLMLYIRMFALMLIGLYASRVVLAALGENDFGIYNVVGGVVAMFTIISGALNSAVQRFITFELGKSSGADISKVYSTAVIIQALIALAVVAIAEPAEPAPLIATVQFSSFLPTHLSALSTAARTTTAVPC